MGPLLFWFMHVIGMPLQVIYSHLLQLAEYGEVENNRPPTHAKYFMQHKAFCFVQKLINKQSSKVICKLEHHTARDRKDIRTLKRLSF